MRKLIVIALLLIATDALALTVGFRAFSSASTAGTSCSYSSGTQGADGVSFITNDITTLDLGTKGTGSLTLSGRQDYKFQCFITSTGVATPAKMFFGSEGVNNMSIISFVLGYR